MRKVRSHSITLAMLRRLTKRVPPSAAWRRSPSQPAVCEVHSFPGTLWNALDHRLAVREEGPHGGYLDANTRAQVR